RSKDGVVMAVEEIPRKLQVAGVTQKIFQVDDHIGVAAAGYIPDARVQVDDARTFSQSHKLIYDEQVEVETVAKHLADRCHQYTQYSGVRPFGVALIIAGVDQRGNLVYVTDPSGTFVSYSAVAIGANAEEVNSFLEKNYRGDMSLDDTIALAIAAIDLKTEQRDGIKHIKAAKITKEKKILEKLSDAELEKYAKAAKEKFPKPA
ncbi:MAG: archaeal proteasome endopeptidase complex subunit alpha, partial [Candidatus Nitrosotenuis sp.]